MSKLRVHELARELGRQNREVIEFLKSKGVDVRSHMSMVDEPAVSEVKNRFRKDNNNRGKEHIAKLETPKTEEKVVTAKSEGDKTETPKKKKNIIQHSCKINFNINSNMKGKVLIKVLSLNLLMIYRMKIFQKSINGTWETAYMLEQQNTKLLKVVMK